MSSWTAKRERDFIVLYNNNLSFSRIAEELGGFEDCGDGGRNACIGKAHRLGLLKREWSESVVRRQRAPTKRVKAEKPETIVLGVAPEPELPPEPWSEQHKVHFMDAGYGQCRWPLWDDNAPLADKFYCGTPTSGDSVCWHHSTVAYTAPPPRKRPYWTRNGKAA